MSTRVDRVKLDEVDWLSILPWLRIFCCFRSAIHPSKLLTAWLFVVLIFAAANLLSLASDSVHPGEIDQYRAVHAGEHSEAEYKKWRESIGKQTQERALKMLRALSTEDLPASLVEPKSESAFFDDARDLIHAHYLAEYEIALNLAMDDEADRSIMLEQIRSARKAALARLNRAEPKPVFKAALEFKIDALDRLCRAAVALRWGTDELIGSVAPANAGDTASRQLASGSATFRHPQGRSDTVIGALRDLFVVLPGWLWSTHPWFLIFYAVAAWLLWSYFGAALSRMTAMQAARQNRISLTDGRRYVHQHLGSYLFAPFAPALVIGVISLVMMVAGFLLFSWVLDVIGGAFFFLALLAGFALAFAILVMVGGLQLFYPAIAFEGAGVFDAVSRGASYVLNRPWRWLFYSMVATVYGAVTYLFLGFVLFFTLWVTHRAVGQWVFADNVIGVDRFADLMPAPTPGDPAPPIDYHAIDGTGVVSAWLIRFWVLGLVALLFAYALSFYSCAQSWIYLLLRRSVDGVGFNDIIDAEGEMPDAAPNKIEPEPTPAQ